MLQLFALFNNFIQNKNQQKSADVALKRLNELIAQLPNMSQEDLESFKTDLISYLNLEYGIDKNDVCFTVSGTDVTMHAKIPTMVK